VSRARVKLHPPSQHVVFDESFFPFADMSTTPMASSALDFLVDEQDLTTPVPGVRSVLAGTPVTALHDALSPGAGTPGHHGPGTVGHGHGAAGHSPAGTASHSLAPTSTAAPIAHAWVAASSAQSASHGASTQLAGAATP
jgi:hypothetical protein